MRRTILLAAVALLLAMVGTPAAAVPQPKGCPAAPSRWMLEDFEGAYAFQLGLAAKAGYTEEDIAELWGLTVEEQRAAYLSGYRSVDSNGDEHLCIKRPAGALGPWSPWMAFAVDNNAAA